MLMLCHYVLGGSEPSHPPLFPRAPPSQASAPAPQPLTLADMAERFAELAAKAAIVPQHCEYATPCGPAARHQGAFVPQPCELSDMHERMAELKQRVARRQAVAAYGDSLAYAQPCLGRAQRKVRVVEGYRRGAGWAGWVWQERVNQSG